MPHGTPHKRSLHRLTLCALFAALLCVLSPIAVPLGPVPLSLGLLGVLLCAATLSPAQSTASVAVFLALGAVGLPIFSGGTGGFGVLLSPTGGYIWSYLLIAPTVGLLARHQPLDVFPLRTLLACLLALPICYTLGTLQLAWLTHTSPLSVLPVTVLPFLPLDLLKATLAATLSRRLKSIIKAKTAN